MQFVGALAQCVNAENQYNIDKTAYEQPIVDLAKMTTRFKYKCPKPFLSHLVASVPLPIVSELC